MPQKVRGGGTECSCHGEWRMLLCHFLIIMIWQKLRSEKAIASSRKGKGVAEDEEEIE